jgi:hypothetical protein
MQRGTVKRRTLALTLLTAAWLVALAIVAIDALDRLEIRPWGNPMSDSLSAPVAGATRVGQLFVAPMPGLYRIEVSLGPGGGGAAQDLIFHLQTEPLASEDLVTIKLSSAQIVAGTPLGFEFEAIRDSMGQRFFFFLEAPAAEPEQALRLRYSPGATLEGATAYLDDQPLLGSLSFHSYYTLRTRDRVNLLLSRMAESRPYFLGSKAFYLFLAAVYALALGAFLYKVGDQVVRESDDES